MSGNGGKTATTDMAPETSIMFNQLTWPTASENLIRFIHRKSFIFYKFAMWAGNVRMVTKMNTYKILVGKPEGKRSLGRRRWMDNIRMDLRNIGWGGMDWIDLAEDMDQ
jgi:hypothetical protein